MRSNQVQLSCYSNSGQFRRPCDNIKWNEKQICIGILNLQNLCLVREKKASVFSQHTTKFSGIEVKKNKSEFDR